MTKTIILIVFIFTSSCVIKHWTERSIKQKTIAIQGFKIILNVDGTEHPEVKEVLLVLSEKLTELTRIIKPEQLHILQTTKIWIEWEMKKDGAMEYHVSRQWLRAHGYLVEKAKCVEINNVKNFLSWQKLNQPYMVLHELAHAYHDKFLGFENVEIKSAYEHALKSTVYDSVPCNLGGRRRAYALNNTNEYFAELTEAYLGVNDFYPFNKVQLQEFDSLGFVIMKKTWN